MEKLNYFLVLEKRRGDYVVIDPSHLDICRYKLDNDLSIIDSFTAKFTKREIKSSISRSNLASLDYLNGSLKIVSDAKHNFPILDKETYTKVVNLYNSKDNFKEQTKIKLYGNYKKIIEKNYSNLSEELLNKFKIYLNSNNKHNVFKMIEELPYLKGRKLYFILGE